MFSVNSGCLFLIFFSGVHSQMDVVVKKTASTPITYQELPSPSLVVPETQDILNSHQRIQDDLKKIGVQMDSEINNNFDFFPHPLNPSLIDRILNEQGQIQIPNFSASLNDDSDDDSSSDEESPFGNIRKFMENSLHFPEFGRRIPIGADPMYRPDQQVYNRDQGNEDIEPVGVLTIIKIDDGTPLQDNVNVPTNRDDLKTVSVNSDTESSVFQGFLNSFTNAMKDMVNLIHNTSISLTAGESPDRNRTEFPIDIKIEDHGRTYEIPKDAFIERSNPDMVNITWRSELENFNNSLCMNVSKDKDGAIVFHHIRLKMLNEQGLQQYERKDPITVGQSKNNSTEINLANGVGLKFPHSDSFDVVVVEKKGKLSTQWLAVCIAMLGLVIAGLIMLLSYILHSRNRYYSRKDSMAKVPIA